jgi:hypothetical protein
MSIGVTHERVTGCAQPSTGFDAHPITDLGGRADCRVWSNDASITQHGAVFNQSKGTNAAILAHSNVGSHVRTRLDADPAFPPGPTPDMCRRMNSPYRLGLRIEQRQYVDQ